MVRRVDGVHVMNLGGIEFDLCTDEYRLERRLGDGVIDQINLVLAGLHLVEDVSDLDRLLGHAV